MTADAILEKQNIPLKEIIEEKRREEKSRAERGGAERRRDERRRKVN
jgi:hypothetical protein